MQAIESCPAVLYNKHSALLALLRYDKKSCSKRSNA